MEWHEYAIRADERSPEVNSRQRIIHHSAKHVWRPKIRSCEHSEDGSHAHHHVEMTDHEISAMQIDVNGWLRQEKSAHAAGHEHRDKSQGEEGSAVDL